VVVSSYTTCADVAGVDLKTVQARLAHSEPRLTLAIYAQATSKADRRAAEAQAGRLMKGRALKAGHLTGAH